MPLVPTASYLDLTAALKKKHQVFNKAAMYGNVAICRFFHSALRGAKLDISKLPEWTRKANGRFEPSLASNAKHGCFEGVEQGGVDDDDDGK